MRSFLHSGNAGDLIYSLPAIKALGGGVLYPHGRCWISLVRRGPVHSPDGPTA